MPKINDLVPSGWKVVGTGMPIEETQTITNPAANDPTAPDNTPARLTQGTGRYYVIVEDPGNGHQRALYLKASPIKGGQEVPVTGQQPSANTVPFTGDLRTIDWTQAGAIADVPAGAKTPTATSKLDKLDAQGNVIAPTDTTTKATQLRDAATGTVINLPSDPAGTLHEMGDDLLLIKPDGSYTTVTSKPSKPTTQSIPNIGLVEYDPSKPEGERTKVLIAAPKDPNAQVVTQTVNGKTYVFDRDSGNFLESNLPADTSVGYTFNDPNSKYIVFVDKQGNEISRLEKPDWKAPVQVQPGSAPAADLISAKIPTFNPQTGALEFIDNPNQIKASEATSQLAQQLGLKVAAGSMSEKQAQDIITGAVNTMNAQSQQAQAQAQQAGVARAAAGDILTNTAQNAQTGAGLINQRVQAASSMLNNTLGLAAGAKNLMSAPAGLGEALTQGIAGWTADLAGGQGTLDSAARLVQQADPRSNMADPATQHAIGVLQQMLDKYQDLTGAPHPAVAATQAAAQSQQTGGMTAPAAAVPAAQPVAGTGFTPPGGSSYSYPSVPWAGATPQTLQSQAGAGVGTGFIAPSAPVRGAPVTITVG